MANGNAESVGLGVGQYGYGFVFAYTAVSLYCKSVKVSILVPLGMVALSRPWAAAQTAILPPPPHVEGIDALTSDRRS